MFLETGVRQSRNFVEWPLCGAKAEVGNLERIECLAYEDSSKRK